MKNWAVCAVFCGIIMLSAAPWRVCCGVCNVTFELSMVVVTDPFLR